MVETKDAERILISSSYIQVKSEESRVKMMVENAKKALGEFEDLYLDIERIWNEYEALSFVNTDKIFYPELNLILYSGDSKKIYLPQFENVDLSVIIEDEHMKDLGFELLTDVEAYKIFFEYSPNSRTHNYKQILCKNSEEKIGIIVDGGDFICLNVNQSKTISPWNLIEEKPYYLKLAGISSVRVPICYHFPKELTKMEVLVKCNLQPCELSETKLWNELMLLLEKEYVLIKNGEIKLTKSGENAVKEGSLKKICNTDLQKVELIFTDKLFQEVELKKCDVEEKKLLFEYYLCCDKLRANLSEYDLKRLEDPNLGHWELWDENIHPDAISINSNNHIIARNPRKDIQEDSVVGIDFGTKSTVVVFQDESGRIKPMPIGCGDIRKVLEKTDFENPTVMQFIDIDSFISEYSKTYGRPNTKWRDLIVSHAANESMKDTGIRSDEFYSYLYDLKQWAGEKHQKNLLRDKNGRTFLLKPYAEVGENENNNSSLDSIDPIELYAYFIGLNVNNMNNGIFLEYLLSFPVTYEKQIRDMIITSFKRGLWKSLPESLRVDENIVNRFKVEAGTSEPAAYAICALEQYGFDPSYEEKVFYGIFDFGGGTTDFDFGLWTGSENEDVYDYRIEHFGSEGDRYLGGENLLQLIAFEAFKENLELCRKEKISFYKPIEYIDVPIEMKGYVNDSQEAKINQKLMMEKLRPFWERNEEDSEGVKDFSEFQISLFNVDGVLKSNLAFEVNVDKLEEIIKQRINKGVRQFFNALKGTFGNAHIQKTSSIEHVNIFLAGNSSKSPILRRIFEENINVWDGEISKKDKNNHEESFFTLFPPLGCRDAYEIQNMRGVKSENELETPNGKTGVAWGIIEGRRGGRIEVVEEITSDIEAKFAYYLGISRKKKFFMKISRDTDYSVWIKFIPAIQKNFEILYTSLPEATNGELLESDDDVLRKRLEVDEYGDGKYIFIRLVGRDQIEYAIGIDEMAINEKSIVKVSL